MQETLRNAVVVGAGIGGLSAAIALRKTGLNVTVYERNKKDAPSGSGITQPQNTFKVLKDLSIYEDCLKSGVQLDYLEIMDKEGNLLLEVNQKFMNADGPGRNSIWRSSLKDVLLSKALSLGVIVEWKKNFTTYQENQTEVILSFEDGTQVSADLLVSFDGIRSQVRDIMLGRKVTPQYLGMGAWRVPITFEKNTISKRSYMLLNGNTKVGIFPLTDKEGYLFILKPVPSDYWDDEKKRYHTVSEILKHFHGKADFIKTCFNKDTPIIFNLIEEVVLEEKWYRNRVVIGGDAAHASAPNLAQGAAMAMEDASVLGEELSNTTSLEEALHSYYVRRFPRARAIQSLSAELLKNELKGNFAQEEIIAKSDCILQEAY
ncbi:FAD-dependent monooxygenase [Priestia filamentosa]|uniref:FAD-dependent monooxygenase n=1 Tax=Priestia filamentosa TaxID=1402861 RepID=UPI003982247D